VESEATLANGCFWCTEAVYARVPGVLKVIPGYAGGHVPHPTYEQVCEGTTGHAECARITFDPATVSYDTLLEVFWATHDPTTLNRQGGDVGTQYRSAIFVHDELQRAAAERSRAEAQKRVADPIVTEIVALGEFYPAEDYHRRYYEAHPFQPYCRLVIAPKVAKVDTFLGK
jgi:peptide-methionine (S)-S-oxide reductase